MTRDQVKKTEASTPLLADHEMYLAYSARLYRFDMVLVYVFDKPDLLTSAHCLFDIRFDATDKHLRDFRSIKGALTRAYGPPSRDEEIWADTEYTIGGISKDTPDQYGRAVLYGYLTYEAEWLTRDSAIGLRLFGEQLRVATIVSLASRQWLEARGMTVFGLKQPR